MPPIQTALLLFLQPWQMSLILYQPLICYAGSAGRNLCKFLTLGKEPPTYFFMNYMRQEKSIKK